MTAEVAEIAPAAVDRARPRREVIYRHKALIRLTHWINVLAMVFLLASGLQIFNAHPQLYWGDKGSNFDHPFLSIHAQPGPGGHARGVTRIGPLTLDTTGVLGVSRLHGQEIHRAWPGWLTVPSWQDLANGRRWHFFFAWIFALNGAVYLLWSVLSRHISRDLWPTGAQMRGIGGSILDHIRLKHATGEDAKRYNVLQKLAYISVALVLLPLMVLTGLTMSPGFNAAAPALLDLLGGRQSARTLHFIAAALLVLFVVVHVVEVLLAGVFNEMRSMITGRYAVPRDRRQAHDHPEAP